jgi:ubiquinone/menaquinone biosynthesis C-methylase UbiE
LVDYAQGMNEQHLEFCASAEWAEVVEHVLLPWVLDGRPLGDQVLEVGAGPGLVTDALRQRVPRLVAVELDRQLAVALARRLAGSGVQVVQADATNLPFHRRSPTRAAKASTSVWVNAATTRANERAGKGREAGRRHCCTSAATRLARCLATRS